MTLEQVNTRRLVLRPFELEDTDALFAFMSDSFAMRHTYVAPSREHCLRRLRTYEAMRLTLGFATELVQFCLDVAFRTLGAPEVQAFAKPDNLASIRVLQKSGFVLLRYEPRLQRNHYAVASSADRFA